MHDQRHLNSRVFLIQVHSAFSTVLNVFQLLICLSELLASLFGLFSCLYKDFFLPDLDDARFKSALVRLYQQHQCTIMCPKVWFVASRPVATSDSCGHRLPRCKHQIRAYIRQQQCLPLSFRYYILVQTYFEHLFAVAQRWPGGQNALLVIIVGTDQCTLILVLVKLVTQYEVSHSSFFLCQQPSHGWFPKAVQKSS